jgi:hypothetical protein
MTTEPIRWSHAHGNEVVPSSWQMTVGIARGPLHKPGEGGAERLDLLRAQARDVLAHAVRRGTRRRARRSRSSQRIPVDDPVLETTTAFKLG